MDFVWFALVGLMVGLVMGQFLQGNNFGVQGDVVFGVIGAIAFGIALSFSGVAPGIGTGLKVAGAAGGALFALVLRRVFKSV